MKDKKQKIDVNRELKEFLKKRGNKPKINYLSILIINMN
jgi:hypothetical protein